MNALRADSSNDLRGVYAGVGLWHQQRAEQLSPEAEIANTEIAEAGVSGVNQTEMGEDEIELSLGQAAPLFQSAQIPVLVAQRIRHRSDFRRLLLQYPCHLRGPEGSGLGIVVTNRIDAIAACQTLMSRKVNGNFPDYLIAEGDHGTKRQLSLLVDLDEASGEVSLRASNAQARRQDIASQGFRAQDLTTRGFTSKYVVEATDEISLSEFSSEEGLEFARRLGLSQAEQDSLARLLEKLYILMTWAGLTRCRLDSLVVGQIGEAIALKGQLTFGPNSPFRQQAAAARRSGKVIHPEQLSNGGFQAPWQFGKVKQVGEAREVGEAKRDLEARDAKPVKGSAIEQGIGGGPIPLDSRFSPPRVVRLGEGNIAVVSNGFSRAMATLEQFQLQGDSAAAFVALPEPGQEHGIGPNGLSQQHQLCQALQALARLSKIKVILINWRSAQSPCQLVADTLVDYQRQLSQQGRCSALSLVVRLVGEGAEAGYQRLQGEEIAVEESLSGAIACSLGLARIGHS